MTKVLFISILASLGAAAVAWGLFLESFEEKAEYRDIDDFRSSRRKSHCGQKWVFWGVIAEMILGFSIAIWDGYEAIKNNPMSQPASEIKAIAVIDINETNTYPALDFSVLNDTYLQLLGTNIYGYSSFSLIPKNFPREFVHKRGFTSDAPVAFVGFAFEFEENPVPTFEFDNFTNFVKTPNPAVKEVLNNTKQMRFYINFIPKNAQIIGGHVTLEVNGFLKFFTVYKQGTDTNISAWNPNATGIYLYATNSIP